MILFWTVVVLLLAIAWRLARPGAAAGLAIAIVLLLPPVYAALVLAQGSDRLDALELRYVGKRVAWGPGVGLTAGGADPDTGAVEDLWAGLLGSGSVRVEPASEGGLSGDADDAAAPRVRAGTPVLRLSGVAPVVRVDGRTVNSTELADGDVLRLLPPAGSSGAALEAVLRDGALEGGGAGAAGWRAELPGGLERVLRPGRVSALRDLWQGADDEGLFSFLEHRDGAWHAVLRDERVRVLRGGEVIATLETPHPLPPEFDFQLQVLWGDAGQRRLRTVRRDRLRFFDEYAEVRFGEPERRRVPLGEIDGPLEMGLVVPSSTDHRPRLLEFQERSPRFHGLSATLRFEPATGEAELEYLGGHWVARRGELYGLGEGNDLMLLRLERTRFPWKVVLDVALCSLFFAVFLLPPLRRSPALTAVIGATGLLLADRVLFAWRAAGQPPDYFVRGYAEARLALWLVPALLLFGWALGVLLRRLGSEGSPVSSQGEGAWRGEMRRAARLLRWPLIGLAVAAAGCFATGSAGDLRLLAFLPLLLAASLLLAYLLAARRSGHLRRWAGAGWRWPLWGLAAAGVVVLAVRGLSLALGMREAIRLPGGSFRLLWTVVQLPLSALLVGVGCHAASEVARSPERRLGGIASVLAFIAMAFGAVGLLVDDFGLFLVHALPAVFALTLLATTGGDFARLRTGTWRTRAVVTLAVVLALGPLFGVLSVNLLPQRAAAAFARMLPEVVSEGAQTPDEPAPVGGTLSENPENDVAERMRATPQQQLFRLYMLANPERLRDVGLRPAERVAVQYDTLKGYAAAAGLAGNGFHSSELPRHLGVTYLNDLMPMAFVLADFGKLGMLALVLTYLALPLAAVGAFRRAGDRCALQGAWVATVALFSVAIPGIYMTLANLNLVLFSGKNSPLLALNSVSDVLQGGALLAVAAFGLALVEAAGRGMRQ